MLLSLNYVDLWDMFSGPPQKQEAILKLVLFLTNDNFVLFIFLRISKLSSIRWLYALPETPPLEPADKGSSQCPSPSSHPQRHGTHCLKA